MPPHHQQLAEPFATIIASFTGDGGRLARLQAKSLAKIIANLLNANEPLLKAEADGAVIAVDERGGTGGFVVTVTPAVPARSLDEGLDPR